MSEGMNSQVFNEDCMEVMKRYPDKYFDLAVVDPPYGIGDFNQSASRKLHKKIEWNNAIPTQQYFDELYRVSKNQIIWGANYYAKYINSVGRLIHDKVANTGQQLHELSDADIASHSFGVNIKIFRYGWRGNVQGNSINWKNEGLDARVHPCQKPIALYDWIFQKYSKPNDKILDTHLGSGSSRIAADRAGLEFVGCELDKDYFEAAEQRFKDYKAQLTLNF
jgi:site-specific DNA-methyltransferase (adenine-specific)